MHHCLLIEGSDIPVPDRQHYSITFGVNRLALLNSLDYFDVTSGALLPDVMHDVLEGALPLEMKLMLKVCYHVICCILCVYTYACLFIIGSMFKCLL